MVTKKKLIKANMGIMTTPQAKSNSSGQATQYTSGVTPSSSTGDASKAGATGTYKKGGAKKSIKKPIKKSMYGTVMKSKEPMMRKGGSKKSC
jgi:hypothetical protein